MRSEPIHDLVVIGGGVMGLMTAWHASRHGSTVTVLERGRIGDPATASYGLTRSYRRDYLDMTYSRLADEAMRLWDVFEAVTGSSVLVRCGCMNIATASVTPDLEKSYAGQSIENLERLGVAQETFDAEGIAERFGWLRADLAYLDPAAGLVDLLAVARTLTSELGRAGAEIREDTDVLRIASEGATVTVETGAGTVTARRVVITAGHGTNDLLARTEGCDLRIPLSKDRPSEARYFTPQAAERDRYTSDVMPVVAYLDTGVYLHPIVEGLTDAVKVGFYNPPDIPRGETPVDDIASFVELCAPGLLDAESREVTVVDQCDYDLVDDDDFVMGAVPGVDHVYVGVGWRGTGYKFAPWVGKTLAEMATSGGTVYDIGRFDPARFVDPCPPPAR